MADSRILLVLLSIALLALTSAQRVNQDDGSSLQEEDGESSNEEEDVRETGDDSKENGDIHKGLNEIKNYFQDQLSQLGNKLATVFNKGKKHQRGRRSFDDDNLEGQDLQSGNERAGGGQGGRGHSQLKGQNGKNSQRGKRVKGGQQEQKGKSGQNKQNRKGGQQNKKGNGGRNTKSGKSGQSQQDNVQEVFQE